MSIDAVKRILPNELRQDLKRILFRVNDMRARLANLRRAGFVCTAAIDAGAYEGDWTRTLWRSFPGVPVLMIEPLPSKAEKLSNLARNNRSQFVAAALGGKSSTVAFLLDETNSQVVNASAATDRDLISVSMTTIDDLLRASPSFKPNLLKLDLQGYEVEALHGCHDPAGLFEMIVIELSVLRIGDVPIFTEVDRYLEDKGFRLYDVIPQYYRPLDGALWQCDAFYVRKDSALISSRKWA